MEKLYNKLQVLKQKNKDFKLFVYIIEFLELIIKYINPFAAARDFNGDIDFTKIKDGDLFYVEQKEEFIEVHDIPMEYADMIEETEDYKNDPLKEYINNDYTINYNRVFQENNIFDGGTLMSIDFNFLNEEDIIKRIHLVEYLGEINIVLYDDFLMNDPLIPKSNYEIINTEEGIKYKINAVNVDFDIVYYDLIQLYTENTYLILSRVFRIGPLYHNSITSHYIELRPSNALTTEGTDFVYRIIFPGKLNTLGRYFNNEYFLVNYEYYSIIRLTENSIVYELDSYVIDRAFGCKVKSLFSLLNMYILSNKYKYYLIYDQSNFRIINENPNIAYIRNKDLDELIKLFAEENEYIISKYDLNNRFHVNLNNGFINTIDSNKIYNYTQTMKINTFCKIKYLDENNVKLILDTDNSSMGDSYQLSQIFIGEFEN